MNRSGTANLPLHNGHAPPWLFERMTQLSAEIARWVVIEHGTASCSAACRTRSGSRPSGR